jgi:hypothetical protein
LSVRNPEFDVALSFAGEDRAYVEKVARHLRDMGLRVFYDKHEAVTLWGKDLYAHLRRVYSDLARYTVIFISKPYRRKLWSNHERQSAQARAFRERREYILPARFDDTSVPGLLGTTGYVDLRTTTPRRLASMVKAKLGPITRPVFFPDEPDVLYTQMRARSKARRNRTYNVAARLFETMKLMTRRERQILIEAGLNACHAKMPDNLHLAVAYLERLTKASRQEILATFARLECLGISARVSEDYDHDNDAGGKLGRVDTLEFEFFSGLETPEGFDNRVMAAIFDTMLQRNCRDCIRDATKALDWSILSSTTDMGHRKQLGAGKPTAAKRTRVATRKKR